MSPGARSRAPHIACVTALLGFACGNGAEPTLSARRSTLSATTGDLRGVVSWNAAPVTGTDSAGFYVAEFSPNWTAAVDPTGQYLAPDLAPGSYSVAVYPSNCPTRRLVTAGATVVAGASTAANFDLAPAAGRLTGAFTLNGIPVPLNTPVRASRQCDFSPCPIGFCTYFTALDTTVGELFGRLLPSGPLQLAVYTETGSGSFSTNVAAGGTNDLEVVALSAGVVEGMVIWDGAPITGPAAERLVVTGQANFGGDSGQPPRQPWTAGLDANGSYTSGSVPPGSYSLRVDGGVRCQQAEGSDSFARQNLTLGEGEVRELNLDIGSVTGLVRGVTTVGGAPTWTTLVLNGGDCDSIATAPKGGFETFLYRGSYNVRAYDQATNQELGEFGFQVIEGQVLDLGFVEVQGSPPPIGPGEPCVDATACGSGFCVDGVCCDTECGGGSNDCQACSVSAGGASDGTCAPLQTGVACGAAPGICETAAVCGGGPVCPGATVIPNCSSAVVPGCAGSCGDISLRGGIGVEDGISVQFQGGVSAGQISVVPCHVLSPPPTGYTITDGITGKYCWDLKVGANVSYTTPPPIIVCIHYPEAIAARENFFQMAHDDGGGVFTMNTVDRFPLENKICGFAYSLSPFAIVQPLDMTGPVFSNVPGPIVTYATSTNGAKVTYAPPKARDAVDGAVLVTCSRASGTTFPVGPTTVKCTAADKTGNKSEATFTVWVQYQAPADGTFFLSPIRANGGSIFRIGKAVPVKFKLTGASAGITNVVARLSITKISNAIQGTVEDVGDEDGEDTDFLFRYRPAKKLYGYRWKTRGETQGTYKLRADLGDGVVHQINVSLRAAK